MEPNLTIDDHLLEKQWLGARLEFETPGLIGEGSKDSIKAKPARRWVALAARRLR